MVRSRRLAAGHSGVQSGAVAGGVSVLEPSRLWRRRSGWKSLNPSANQRPGLNVRLRPDRGEGQPGDRGRCATVRRRLPEPQWFRFRGLGSLKPRQCVPGFLEQARATSRPGSAGRDGGVVEVKAGNRSLAAEGAGGWGRVFACRARPCYSCSHVALGLHPEISSGFSWAKFLTQAVLI